MKLYNLLPKNGDEVTVVDKDYDMEAYFYYVSGKEADRWDKAMMKLAKVLDAKFLGNGHVEVNLSDLVESHIDKLKGLFIHCEIDAIMEGMDLILSGYVSEHWMEEFATILSK